MESAGKDIKNDVSDEIQSRDYETITKAFETLLMMAIKNKTSKKIDDSEHSALEPETIYASANGEDDLHQIEMVFASTTVPMISISDYTTRLLRGFEASTDVLIIATIYVERLLYLNNQLQLTAYNVHRFVFASILLAFKYDDDTSSLRVRNRDFLGGLSHGESNLLEIGFLALLRFNLFIEEDEFKKYSKAFSSMIDQMSVHSALETIRDIVFSFLACRCNTSAESEEDVSSGNCYCS